MASSGLLESDIFTKITTYHRWHHLLCEERHLLPKCLAPKWRCCRTPYLPIVGVVGAVCGLPMCYFKGWCCGSFAVSLDEIKGRIYLGWKSQVLNKTSSLMLVPATVPTEGWIIDPYAHSLLNGPGEGM